MYTHSLTYDGLKDYILKGKNKVSRPLAHNTTVRIQPDFGGTSIVVKYHDTDIASFEVDGSIMLNTGGWRTSTTKARLSELLPHGWNVYQSRGVWYVWNYEIKKEWTFADGMVIYPAEKRVVGYGDDPRAVTIKRTQIRRYAGKYMGALLAGEVSAPSEGDCWYCFMHTESGESLGESIKDTSHLDSHMEESYFVPSLLYNAFQAFPGSFSMVARHTLSAIWMDQPDQRVDVFDSVLRDQGKKALIKYLYQQYGLAR